MDQAPVTKAIFLDEVDIVVTGGRGGDGCVLRIDEAGEGEGGLTIEIFGRIVCPLGAQALQIGLRVRSCFQIGAFRMSKRHETRKCSESLLF